jgi:hypothetical protein
MQVVLRMLVNTPVWLVALLACLTWRQTNPWLLRPNGRTVAACES